MAIAIVVVAVSLLALQPKSLSSVVGHVLTQVLLVVLPIACIWWGDELADYIPAVTKPSPGWLVRLGGWVLLLVRIVIWWVAYRN